MGDERPTRECPFCQETIFAEATKCRWCGEMMPDAARPRGSAGDTPGRRPPTRRRARHPEGASTILIFGILSWLLCVIFGAFAWSKGNEYESQCRALRLEPEGSAVAGRILGMISVILTLIGVGLVLILIVAGAVLGAA